MATIEELQAENAALKDAHAKLERTAMMLRFAANKPDLEKTYASRKALGEETSPCLGARVKVAHPGCKYAHKDFESVFEGTKIEYTDQVEQGRMGFVIAKAPHFKKTTQEVFLVKLDNNKGAVFSRKGIEPIFYEGAYVTVANTGCKYSGQDFSAHFADYTLVDNVRQEDRGVIVKIDQHYKNSAVKVYLVALNTQLECVVMNGKGLVLRDVPGLAAYTAKKAKDEAEAKAKDEAEAKKAKDEAEAKAKDEAEAKAKEEAEAKAKDEAEAKEATATASVDASEAGEKRTADEAEVEEPEAKKAK